VKKIIIVFIALSLSFVLAQGQKIGYVNIEYIYAQNEDARLAYADFEKEGKRLQAELENKAMTLDSLMRDYTKLELMWSEDMKLEKRKQIEDLQIEVETFQSKYFSQPNGEIYIMLQQRMAPINELIQSAIDKVAAEKAYDFVLDISQGIVLYKLDSYDLTQLVVDELNKMSINKSDE
tara:strand:- start:4539 stop:5072 length:534 start_codon:yes stop_codon:yes gene_type:complete